MDPFTPSPDRNAELLTQLCDPALSLNDIAESHGTTPEALALYITLPSTLARLQTIQTATSIRTRHIAVCSLRHAAMVLTQSLQEYLDEALNKPADPTSIRALEQRRRSRETARKAASLLLRLATFDPAKPPSRKRTSPTDPASSPDTPIRPSPHPIAPIPSLQTLLDRVADLPTSQTAAPHPGPLEPPRDGAPAPGTPPIAPAPHHNPAPDTPPG